MCEAQDSIHFILVCRSHLLVDMTMWRCDGRASRGTLDCPLIAIGKISEVDSVLAMSLGQLSARCRVGGSKETVQMEIELALYDYPLLCTSFRMGKTTLAAPMS